MQNSLQTFQKYIKDYCLESNHIDTDISTKFHDLAGLEIYANLIWFGWLDLMTSVYPMCKIVLGEDFSAIARNYLKTYPANNFHFNKLAKNFSQYLLRHEEKLLKKIPYLAELAHYEWIELECIEDSARFSQEPITFVNDLAYDFQLKPNPTLKFMHLQYPLVKIADKIIQHKNPQIKFRKKESFIIAFRHPQNHECVYSDISEFAYKLLSLACNQSLLYQELALYAINNNLGLSPQNAIIDSIIIVEKLYNIGAVLNQLKLLEA